MYIKCMLLMMISCVVRSDQEFAVLNDGVDSICERYPYADGCQPEEEMEPPPENDLGTAEEPLPEDRSCDSEMRIRKVLPGPDAVVPVNVKPIVLTIGNGDDTHMVVDLKKDGQSVPHQQEVSCYIHEGDEEFHCTYLINPLNDLSANEDYYISVLTSDIHPSPGSDSGQWFRTGTQQLTMDDVAPETEFEGYMDREPTAVQECDWKDAMKYEITTTVVEETRGNLSVIQVYEVHDINTGDETLQHSIILPPDMQTTTYRQVIRPGDEYPLRCYRAVHRDIAGNESPSSETICWEE